MNTTYQDLIGDRVRIYYNLHKECLSIQTWQKSEQGKYRWKVAAHLKDAFLTDVTFKVYEAGRLRTITKKQKNVHAYILGTLISMAEIASADGIPAIEITYNPYRFNSFVSKAEHTPVHNANFCYIHNKSVAIA